MSFFILSDKVFDFGLSATSKGWRESIGFPDPELHAESFGKRIKYSRSFSDPENNWCGN